MIVDLDGWTVISEQDLLVGATKFKLTNLANWYSSPPVRIDITEQPTNDGGFNPVRAYRSSKPMQIEGVCFSTSPEAAVRDAYQRIAALGTTGQQMTLTVTDDVDTKTMRVWLNGNPQVEPFGPASARFAVPIIATDPRKYGPVQTGTTGPSGGSEDGLEWPLFEDGYLSFGEFSPTGLFYIKNEGTAESWPTFKVRGTVTGGFQIVSDQDIIEYSANVPLGSELVLSPYAGGRATTGQSDVTIDLTQSDWAPIEPGETKAYVFVALGTTDANAQLSYAFSSAWW
jgi:hypothetical protein